MNSTTIQPKEIEKVQKELFDQLSNDYDVHFNDRFSKVYRARFFYPILFDNIDLKNKNTLEAMCSSGVATEYLVQQNALVTGLDISEASIQLFKDRWPNCQGLCASILSTGLPDNSFDVVVLIGGLHHVHPFVDDAIREIHRILKPNGYFCFGEPHAGSFIDVLRKIWYRYDSYFESNEKSVDIKKLQETHNIRFEVLKDKYMGNLAYMFVLQSLWWRIPPGWKKYYASLFMMIESWIQPFLNPITSIFCLQVWQKKGLR